MASTTQIAWNRPHVVGTIHNSAGWAASRRADLDFVEVRLDCLESPPVAKDFERLKVPVILTARDQREGGRRSWTAAERCKLLLFYLERAAAVDVEVRNLRKFRELLKEANRRGIAVIASIHDFDGFPSGLAGRVSQAREWGATVVKIAARADSPADVARLAALFREFRGPLAVMGMGRLGQSSRLVCAVCGSCLNYGWLGSPQVFGQWPARWLRSLFRGLGL